MAKRGQVQGMVAHLVAPRTSQYSAAMQRHHQGSECQHVAATRPTEGWPTLLPELFMRPGMACCASVSATCRSLMPVMASSGLPLASTLACCACLEGGSLAALWSQARLSPDAAAASFGFAESI